MLVEDQPLDLRRPVEGERGKTRQAEARPRIGHETEPALEHVGTERLAVGLVDDAQDRGGVGVVDERRRHEGVQQHLDRRYRRQWIEAIAVLYAHEVVVAQAFARAQSLQRFEPHGRKAGGLDGAHVPAGAFDEENVDLVAGKIARFPLEGGIAAAMQDELRIAAEEAGRIDALRQCRRNAERCVFVDESLRVALDPGGFHPSVPHPKFVSLVSLLPTNFGFERTLAII